jgi:hypothetical protein
MEQAETLNTEQPQSWLQESIQSSLKSALLILKLVVPFYILADILLYFELLRPISIIFTPITALLGLPGEASVAIGAGILLNLYAAVAFAAPLGLDPFQWTVLGTFLGVCHSLPIESAIMKKLGISLIYSVSLRLIAAFIAVVPVLLLPKTWFKGSVLQHRVEPVHYDSPGAMLLGSFGDAVLLSLKIIVLITVIIFLMDLLKRSSLVTRYGARLPTAFSFLAGQLLGITYGAGILFKEAASGNLNKRDILFIGTFLMVCHSLLEDPLLFVLFGANYWIMTGVRLFMACIVGLLVTRLVKNGFLLRRSE